MLWLCRLILRTYTINKKYFIIKGDDFMKWKLPNPWILGAKIGYGLGNLVNCGTWGTCKAY